MRTFGVVTFALGIALIVGGFYWLENFGIARSFLLFLWKMTVFIALLISGMVLLFVGNKVAKAKN
jgi:hypothetical protein